MPTPEPVPAFVSDATPDGAPESQPFPPVPLPALSNGHADPDGHRAERPPAWAAAGGGRPLVGRPHGPHDGPVANVRIVVNDPAGVPIAGAVLTLLDGVGRHLDRGWTDEQGEAGFPVAGPAEVVLVARHRGHRPAARTVHVPHAGPTAEREVSITVTLAPAVVLHGTVRAAGGRRPIAGALVELTDEHGTVLASTRTDDRGAYQLADLSAGARTLVVTPDHAAPITSSVELGPSGNFMHDVALSGRTGVAGVARSPEGVALPDAVVWLSDAAGHVIAQTRTDAEGAYRLVDVPAGAYTLSAVGYPPATAEVEVTDGDDVETILTLRHVEITQTSF